MNVILCASKVHGPPEADTMGVLGLEGVMTTGVDDGRPFRIR